MSLKIYNTLTHEKEEFKSLEEKHVRMYVCGPTVYNFVHIGNFRGAIFFGFVRNYLEHLGYKVTFVYNYTDVDDKIIKTANEQKITPFELADKFVKEFEHDYNTLGLRQATVNPRVTTHMKEIIDMIQAIIDQGAGYIVDGEVFCSIEKIQDYGKLSHKNLDDLIAGSRVEIGEKKRNPVDFSLWKPAKAGEPFWESPWGKGRPGWHIECSAMAKKYLGDTFDIHGGGIDLIFPHHENEIAQSEAANAKPFVKYWMHNNFINMGKEKMSKSLGNTFTARHFLERYNGEILKFLILSSHYRSPSDFAENIIHNTMAGLARVYSALCQAEKWGQKCINAGFKPAVGAISLPKAFQDQMIKVWPAVREACDDDFNSPLVLGEIFSLVRAFNALIKPGVNPSLELAYACQQFTHVTQEIGALMSLFQEPAHAFLVQLDDLLLREKGLKREEIQPLVDARFEAKKAKDFKKSDEIRDKLLQLGIELRDSVEGTEWEVKK